jgi:L,D-transpeptidase catalytic domain
MRRTFAAVFVLLFVVGGISSAQAEWPTAPPHQPPPPGGKLGLIEAALGGPLVAPPNVGPGPRGWAVPAHSGAGRRVVYSISLQHVWAVEANGVVVRDYPVSGRRGLPSVGTHRVYSRSRVSRSGSLTLNYMVRFARGRTLAIGFHEIPKRPNGTYIQTLGELGQPRSHGCVRQAAVDAAFMWEFGQIGTPVVVLP